VRRAAAKAIAAVITSFPDLLNATYPAVTPALLARFREREETVKADVFATFVALLQQVGAVAFLWETSRSCLLLACTVCQQTQASAPLSHFACKDVPADATPSTHANSQEASALAPRCLSKLIASSPSRWARSCTTRAAAGRATRTACKRAEMAQHHA